MAYGQDPCLSDRLRRTIPGPSGFDQDSLERRTLGDYR